MLSSNRGSPRGLIAKVVDYVLEGSEFKLQRRHNTITFSLKQIILAIEYADCISAEK